MAYNIEDYTFEIKEKKLKDVILKKEYIIENKLEQIFLKSYTTLTPQEILNIRANKKVETTILEFVYSKLNTLDKANIESILSKYDITSNSIEMFFIAIIINLNNNYKYLDFVDKTTTDIINTFLFECRIHNIEEKFNIEEIKKTLVEYYGEKLTEKFMTYIIKETADQDKQAQFEADLAQLSRL